MTTAPDRRSATSHRASPPTTSTPATSNSANCSGRSSWWTRTRSTPCGPRRSRQRRHAAAGAARQRGGHALPARADRGRQPRRAGARPAAGRGPAPASRPRERSTACSTRTRGGVFLLRHLAEAEMDDAVRPDEFRQRFAAARDAAHPNLAATVEVLEINGRPAALQEWLTGLPSADWPAEAAVPGVWVRLAGRRPPPGSTPPTGPGWSTAGSRPTRSCSPRTAC